MNKEQLYKYTNIVLALGTGLLAVCLVWDLLDFVIVGHHPMIRSNSIFGCIYKSAKNYMLFSTVRAAAMSAAFGSGFFFKNDMRKAILARSCFFVLYIFS